MLKVKSFESFKLFFETFIFIEILGEQLITKFSTCPKDTIEPKTTELLRIRDLFTDRLERRLETLSKARDLMENVERANDWCTKGIELMAAQQVEKCSIASEVTIAEQNLQELNNFIASAADFSLSSPKEFKNVFEESKTVETKAIVSQVRFYPFFK